jgi:hypothetical protein
MKVRASPLVLLPGFAAHAALGLSRSHSSGGRVFSSCSCMVMARTVAAAHKPHKAI